MAEPQGGRCRGPWITTWRRAASYQEYSFQTLCVQETHFYSVWAGIQFWAYFSAECYLSWCSPWEPLRKLSSTATQWKDHALWRTPEWGWSHGCGKCWVASDKLLYFSQSPLGQCQCRQMVKPELLGLYTFWACGEYSRLMGSFSEEAGMDLIRKHLEIPSSTSSLIMADAPLKVLLCEGAQRRWEWKWLLWDVRVAESSLPSVFLRGNCARSHICNYYWMKASLGLALGKRGEIYFLAEKEGFTSHSLHVNRSACSLKAKGSKIPSGRRSLALPRACLFKSHFWLFPLLTFKGKWSLLG